MEIIVLNLSPKTRREKIGDREYLVAPATILTEGVLPGSQGPLFYPADEITKNFDSWNGMPIVGRHPVRDGVHVSARRPDVLNDQGLGYFFNATVGGPLAGEFWFDVLNTERFDQTLPAPQQILPRLNAGQPIELSTGLFTRNVPAEKGATFNGVAYNAVARDHRPDHIAVLPDERGACGVKDGCGVLVNGDGAAESYGLPYWKQFMRLLGVKIKTLGDVVEEKHGGASAPTPTDNGGSDMDRKAAISFLTTNCACWKGDKAKALDGFTDDQVKELAANARMLLVVNAVRTPAVNDRHGVWKQLTAAQQKAARHVDGIRRITVNADGEGETAGIDIAALAEFLGVTTDPASDPVAFVKEIQGKLQEVLGKLGGPAETPAEQEPTASQEETPEEKAKREEEEKAKMATNRKPAKPLTDAEWLKQAPPGVRSAVTNALRVEQRAKQQVIERLTANLEGDRRELMGKRLMAKSLDELNELAEMIPPVEREEWREPVANYFGAAGAPGRTSYDGTKFLMPKFAGRVPQQAK